MSFEGTVAKINAAGWFILNTHQIGLADISKGLWRVNCQLIGQFDARKRFTEYADGSSLQIAVDAALENVLAANEYNRSKDAKAAPAARPVPGAIPEKLAKRLERAADGLWMALKVENARTRGDDRADDL